MPTAGLEYAHHFKRDATSRVQHYRGYVIEVLAYKPPIPTPWPLFEYVHKNYDGPGDGRCGVAESLEDAMREIDELEDER
jgi:hypothetical protein